MSEESVDRIAAPADVVTDFAAVALGGEERLYADPTTDGATSLDLHKFLTSDVGQFIVKTPEMHHAVLYPLCNELVESRVNLKIKKLEEFERRTDLEMRRQYADIAKRLVYFWLSVVTLVLIGASIKSSGWPFRVSDQVLIALLTTTTVTVISLFAIVYRYLFHRTKPPV